MGKAIMNRRATLLLIIGACALPGCAAVTSRVDDGFSASDYRLATDDRVRLIVFGQDDLSNIYTVDGAGRITVPLIGAVDVEGLTTEAAARRVAQKMASGFIREPQVTIEVDTYRPFYVMGEVGRAGQYPYVAGMTVETAVAIGGGFSARPRAVTPRSRGGRRRDHADQCARRSPDSPRRYSHHS